MPNRESFGTRYADSLLCVSEDDGYVHCFNGDESSKDIVAEFDVKGTMKIDFPVICKQFDPDVVCEVNLSQIQNHYARKKENLEKKIDTLDNVLKELPDK